MFSTQPRIDPSKKSLWILSGMGAIYLIFQLFIIPHTALSVDELWFAYHIHDYTLKVPYRDFWPYKTVLGYYLLSIPMHLTHAVLQPLYYIKDEIAVINAVLLTGSGLWLARFYRSNVVLFTLACLLANHLFLIYSVDLRVDMLTAWIGLLSILCVLSGRFSAGGILLSLGLMISQKTLWFFFGTNVALATHWLIFKKHPLWGPMIVFNLGVIFPFCGYLIFWSSVSSPSIVIQSIFIEGYHLWHLTWYSQIWSVCWSRILSNGPLLMLLWPFTSISLFFRTQHDETVYQRRVFIFIYSTVILICMVSYQQAFPYGMVIGTPAFFLLFADFFDWLRNGFEKNKKLAPFAMPIFAVLIYTGICYPLMRTFLMTYAINSHYQQSMMKLSHALIKDGGGYFAGTPLLYDHDQAIPGLNNLIGPAIEYLSTPSKKLLPILIPSLYLKPRTTEQVLQDLKTTPVKLYVNNYRIQLLPSSIHHYLDAQFTHYWGSIYIYAPVISLDKNKFHLKFSGHYEIITQNPDQAIYLDHKKILSHQILFLKQGEHLSQAKKNYRLKYTPDLTVTLDRKDAEDRWYTLVKPIVF